METKIRWLRSEQLTAALMKKSSGLITAHPFTFAATRGFLVNKTRGSAITAKFVEKVSGKRELIDPFGNSILLPFVNYEIVQFRLSSEFPHLELVNAPKFPRKFFSFLSEITGEPFAFSPLELDLRKWTSAIAAAFGTSAISEIDYSDLMVSVNVAADVNFYGAGDVDREAGNFVGKRSASLRRVKLLTKPEGRPVVFELSRTGLFKTTTEMDPRLIDELRRTIVAAAGEG